MNSFSFFAGWSLVTFLSMESQQGFYYDVNMLVYYLACLVIVICSIFELKNQNSRQVKDINRSKSKIFKKKRWRKKKPFRQKDGRFYKRAQRRKKLQQSAYQKTENISSLEQIWQQQNNWDLQPNYFDNNNDGWLSKPTYCLLPSSYLHLNNYATDFDRICSIRPCLVNMFLGKGDPFLNERVYRLLDLVFVSDNKAMDLTTLTSTNSIFRFQSLYHVDSTNEHPIVFDTGASITILPHKDNFINLDCSASAINAVSVKGLDSESHVQGVGTIRLMVHTDQGHKRTLETTAYYIPSARIRLLSVCRYQYENPKQGCKFVLTDNECFFTLPSSAGGGDISFEVQDSNFIPVTSSFTQQNTKPASVTQRTFMVLDEANINLSRSQKALLKLHFRLGHFNLPWIQSLIRKGILHTDDSNSTSKTALCKCMACQMAKQVRRPTGITVTKVRQGKDGALKKYNLRPGGMISSNQFVSSLPGRLPNTYGKENEKDKYTGGTVFIDEASSMIFVENQVSLGAAEIIRTKHKFEREALRHGIPILGYRADNGVYKTAAFRAVYTIFRCRRSSPQWRC